MFIVENFLSTANIQGKTKPDKVLFVNYILSLPELEVITEFKTTKTANKKQIQNIFSEAIYHGEQFETTYVARNWLFIEPNKFYCVYCLCFGTAQLKSNDFLTDGLVLDQQLCRLTQIIRRHESSKYHDVNRNIYLRSKGSPSHTEDKEKARIVIKAIIKIIIFIVTHSKFCCCFKNITIFYLCL